MLFYYTFGALVGANIRLGKTTWRAALDGLRKAPDFASGAAMVRGIVDGWKVALRDR